VTVSDSMMSSVSARSSSTAADSSALPFISASLTVRRATASSGVRAALTTSSTASTASGPPAFIASSRTSSGTVSRESGGVTAAGEGATVPSAAFGCGFVGAGIGSAGGVVACGVGADGATTGAGEGAGGRAAGGAPPPGPPIIFSISSRTSCGFMHGSSLRCRYCTCALLKPCASNSFVMRRTVLGHTCCQ